MPSTAGNTPVSLLEPASLGGGPPEEAVPLAPLLPDEVAPLAPLLPDDVAPLVEPVLPLVEPVLPLVEPVLPPDVLPLVEPVLPPDVPPLVEPVLPLEALPLVEPVLPEVLPLVLVLPLVVLPLELVDPMFWRSTTSMQDLSAQSALALTHLPDRHVSNSPQPTPAQSRSILTGNLSACPST
jgi:hypothetical protein